jgi:calcineurin-like phosphoesterase
MGVDCMTSGNHIWDKREIIAVTSRGAAADPAR